ncbi:MAG: SPFH domain-containing protein [Chloroflexi bacterium]|nr:SPFH domain-containing protein [Ktedonobacteraceae bacterium]MBV9020638.1 SPFH domain-containing protein [Ktedonobacteraceae bacterium]MBV9708326.1 SPFH domain-containing protein [Chloroflexota bacterium]
MGLIDVGIRLMDNVDKDIRRIGQRLGFMPLSWRQVVMGNPAKDGLLWRIPDPDVAMANSLIRIQAIIVSEHERAIVLKDGRIADHEILYPGLYDIRRTMEVRGQIEIIWTTTTEFQIRWGVPDVLTRDRVSVGASGFCLATIVAPEAFLTSVAGNAQVYTKENLAAFTRSDIGSLLRDLMARKTVMEFQLARDEFIYAAREKLDPIFARWGLEFRGLTIENQRIPEEFRQAAQARVKIQMEKEAELEGAQADVSLAQLEAQRRIYLAQAEATEHYVIGNAEVEKMRRQLSIDMDPLKLMTAEAMRIAAANPSQGSLVDGRIQIMGQLSGVLNAPSPTEIPPVNPSVALGPTTIAASASSTVQASEPMTREKIESILDKLDERFANGEISEQTYLQMHDKWQKKLNQLP